MVKTENVLFTSKSLVKLTSKILRRSSVVVKRFLDNAAEPSTSLLAHGLELGGEGINLDVLNLDLRVHVHHNSRLAFELLGNDLSNLGLKSVALHVGASQEESLKVSSTKSRSDLLAERLVRVFLFRSADDGDIANNFSAEKSKERREHALHGQSARGAYHDDTHWHLVCSRIRLSYRGTGPSLSQPKYAQQTQIRSRAAKLL
mmetsp:Transcript_11416/g.22396  ORF Transcript_11416/g.22396 Transcript_11416/m.22396 type:complete len:203 (-) Transcript_11416:33-641(-)